MGQASSATHMHMGAFSYLPQPNKLFGSAPLSKSKLPNYYSVLGITPEATPAEIRAAFRQQAKLVHPDASRTRETTAQFLIVKEAFECLSDTQRRREFDRRRKIVQLTDIAASFLEILIGDLAVPLSRDVAAPLLRNFVGKVAHTTKIFFHSPMKSSFAALHVLSRASEHMQVAWKAQELQRQTQELDLLTGQVSKSREAQASTALALARRFEVENAVRRKLLEVTQSVDEASWGYQVLRARRVRIEEAEEETERREKAVAWADMSRTCMALGLAECPLVDRTTLEAALQDALARTEQAREGLRRAQDSLAAIKPPVLEKLVLDITSLTPSAASGSRRKTKANGETLYQGYIQYLSRQQALEAELSAALRAREVAQKDLANVERESSRYQRRAAAVARSVDATLESLGPMLSDLRQKQGNLAVAIG